MKIKLSIYKAKRFNDDIEKVLNLERVRNPIEFNIDEARVYLYAKQFLDPKPPEWTTLFTSQKPELIIISSGKIVALVQSWLLK